MPSAAPFGDAPAEACAEPCAEPCAERSADSSADPFADVRLELRSGGYCVLCDAIVERTAEGSCAAGHTPAAIAGHIPLAHNEPLPVLPHFNLAAFLIPPIWGPAHGQWAGAIFLPIWLFADSAVVAAARAGGLQWIAASAVIAGTLAFEVFFARKANGVAFRRVMHKMTAEQYVARQRPWALAALPIAAALIGWGVYFDLVLAATIAR